MALLAPLQAADAAVATEPAPAARETSWVAPVWQLDVDLDSTGIAPRLIINAFADPSGQRRFPVHELPIWRVTAHPEQSHGDFQTVAVQLEIARLQVEPNGRIDPGCLGFVPSELVSVDPWSGRVTFLYQVGAGASPHGTAGGDSTRDFHVDPDIVPGDMYRWEASPDGAWGLEFTTAGAFLLTHGGAPTRPRVPALIVFGRFSRDGSKYAAASLLRSVPEVNRWAVFGRDGILLREGPARPNRIDGLEFTPDGMWLLVRYAHGDTVCVRLADGVERPLPAGWWDGLYDYSADGRMALSVTERPDGTSLATFFDCRDPLKPAPVSQPLVIATFVTAAALSEDGRLAAFDEETQTSAGLRRIIVYDRRWQRWTVLLTNTRRAGLHFAGRYLVVGAWQGAFGERFQLDSTKGILVYDLSGL